MRKYIKWLVLFIAYLFAISGEASVLKNIGLVLWAFSFVSCVLLTVFKEREE